MLNKAWLQSLLAICAGTLITLSLAPFDVGAAGVAALVVLLFLLANRNPRTAFARGWFFGVGLFGSGASWVYVSIYLYGNAPAPLAVLLTLLFCLGLALLSALTCYIYRRLLSNDGYMSLAVFPALWVLGEWLRTWLLSGFPWLFIGYAQIDGPLHGWAPLLGVFGISYFMALSAVCIFLLLRRNRNYWLLIPGLVPWLLGPLLNTISWVQPLNKEVTVGLVQANIAQQEKWQPAKIPGHIQLHERLTEKLWGKQVIVWPEAAIPMLYANAKPIIDRLDKRAQQRNSAFFTGIPYRNDGADAGYHNSIVALGTGSGIYFKRRLVPFGEYVPLENVLRGLIDFFDLPTSHFTPGPSEQSHLQANGLRVAPFICYEVVYPALLQTGNKPLPDFLLTISNDTWFGASIGPLQHLQMARMRALELGRAMIRGTNNGVSALIDADGSISAQTTQFEQEVLTGTIQLYSGKTPYARFGNNALLLFCAACVALPLLRRKSKSNSSA
ncbi:MAG: apolipoprotein N-acyltransferase [Pseudomonadales bacterium]